MDKTNKQKSKIFEPPKSKGKRDFEGVEKQAKEILDKFAKALEKVKTSQKDFYVDREEFEREEKVSSTLDVGKSSKDDSGHDVEEKGDKCIDFKEDLLKNAPNKDKDFVIAEKGSWK